MKNLAIFYGGKSVEHDISIITAINLLSNVDKKKYNVFPVYIDKNNNWKILKNYMNISSYICQPSGVFLVTGFYNKYLVKKGAFGLKRLAKIDVAINCCHGAYGEDGSLSGLLKLAGIPLVGSGVLASSVGMDKAMMKDVFVANGIPCPKYYYFTEMDYNIHKYELMNKLEADIEYPMIVKPSGLGSSIGINISKNRQDLINNVEIALKFDKKVIVESVIENLREINCSVIGNYNEVRTSILEEPKNWKTFLNFDEKYLNFDSSKKQIDVHINQQIDDQIRQLAIKCFKLLGCSGVVRIDFLYDEKNDKVYVNEINTVPGSLANYLWKDEYSFSQMVDLLVSLAEKEYQYMNECSYTYSSNVLDNFKDMKYISKVNKFTK